MWRDIEEEKKSRNDEDSQQLSDATKRFPSQLGNQDTVSFQGKE